MLSQKTKEALKVFLAGVKEDTGLEPNQVDVSQYRHSRTSEKTVKSLIAKGFEKKGVHEDVFAWLSADVELDKDVKIHMTCFHEHLHLHEPELTYCTEEGCLNETESGQDICRECYEKLSHQDEEIKKHEDYEYRSNKL